MNDTIYILIQGSVKFKTGRLRGCLDTWLKNFKYYLISSDGSHGPDIPHIVATDLSDWHSCPPKLFKGLDELANNPMGCQWIFICDDDTFVNYLNLSELSSRLNSQDRKIYGRDMTGNFPFKNRQLRFLSGGAGTLIPMQVAKEISNKLQEKDFKWVYGPSRWPPRGNTEFPEDSQADVKLGCIAAALNIQQINFPKFFHSEPPQHYKHNDSGILSCVTYHRLFAPRQLELMKIINSSPSILPQ